MSRVLFGCGKNVFTLRQVGNVTATGIAHEGVFFGALGAGFGATLGAHAVVVWVNLFVAAVTIHIFYLLLYFCPTRDVFYTVLVICY